VIDMLRATIDDLRIACSGTLRLGSMPPLDGERTLIRGVTHYLSQIVPGSVYWPLDLSSHDLADGYEVRLAEEALAQGATGVVIAGRRITPWAGCWTLQINDAWSAWCEWQLWANRHGLTWDDEEIIPPTTWSRTRPGVNRVREYEERKEYRQRPPVADDSARAVVIRIHEFLEHHAND
jgi:hypothetical protein